MPIAVGRLVALALGYLNPLHDLAHGREHDTVPTDGLSDGFLDGFTPQPALDGRPPQVGFRRPQQAERLKRDCLANGTNFCFGDSSSYCSSCGTCCSSPSNGNNKWCCPSGGICCGSSCCGSGQTCNNGQCYIPVETITATSSIAVTSTQIVTSLTTIFQKVLESSVVESIVEVTNTNAETQTNWVYVTATTVGKRAEPTGLSLKNTSDNSDSTSLDGLGGLGGISGHNNVGASSEIASTTTNEAITSTLPIHSTTPVMPFITSVPIPSTEPAASTEAIAAEPILPRQVQTEANTMAATRSTSTVIQGVTTTSIVTSVIASTTTVVTTSTNIQTVFQTNTVVLNAKTTVEATSTWTYTSHRPVTVTLTEIATIPHSNTGSATSSTAAPALITSVTDGVLPESNLSSSAIAGIAIGAAVFGIALCLGIFYVSRRHLTRAKERKAITEDYAYFGTGRSDFDGPARSNSNSGSGGSPPMIMHNSHYSGPPPPSARMSSVRKPATSHVDPMGNERGLPPIPWYSAAAKTSPPTSPVSPTSGSLPFSNELKQQVSPTSPSYSRAIHVRSGSAQTTGTSTSSTVVGGSSNRNSVRSNSGKTARISNGGIPHKRASSSGSGTTSTVNETTNDAPGETAANVLTVEVTPVTPAAPVVPLTPVAPSELPSIPAPRAYLSPDPPSPMLQPQLGPLRIVNGSIEVDDPSDQDEPMPKAPPRAR